MASPETLYPKHHIDLNYDTFQKLVSENPAAVVLLEGRREIPEPDKIRATHLARELARQFPRLRFRSGNAPGSDEAFCNGVAEVDPTRLEIITPYAGHRKKASYKDASYHCPENLPVVEQERATYLTSEASPKSKGLINQFGKTGRAAAKANYLVRDTLKVTGIDGELDRPIAALFWADPDDPMQGGTGHTIRVCQKEKVPTILQSDWQTWPL